MTGPFGPAYLLEQQPSARKALGKWWVPFLTYDGIHATRPVTPPFRNLQRELNLVATSALDETLSPNGPRIRKTAVHPYATLDALNRLSDRDYPSWAEELTARRADALRESLLIVDGKLHRRVGEPIWRIASRYDIYETYAVQFSDLVEMQGTSAYFRLDDIDRARALATAGHCKKHDPAIVGFPDIEFDPAALDRDDTVLGPAEIAWSVGKLATQGKSAYFEPDVLMTFVPLMRAIESRARLDADTVRTLVAPVVAALATVPDIDFRGTSRTPRQHAQVAAFRSRKAIDFQVQALSRFNATYVPTDEDEAALDGLSI